MKLVHPLRRVGALDLFAALTLFLVVAGLHMPAFAQDGPRHESSKQEGLKQQEQSKADRIETDRKIAHEAARKVAKTGPALIKLAGQAEFSLPAGYVYVPQPEAGQIMRADGNKVNKNFIGLVFPNGAGHKWWATIEFIAAGYVKDDEAKNWDADALLKNLQDGTEAGNVDRAERGFPPIEVTGWAEPPAYDEPTHRLVWSAIVRNKGDATDEGSINYNTYALGRDGYFSLDLITDPGAVATNKTYAKQLLSSIAFDNGKKYTDFNAATDHIAEYGIAALVGGVVVKKLGLLAVIGVFLLKAWKLALVGFLAVGAVGRKIMTFFTRRKPPETPA